MKIRGLLAAALVALSPTAFSLQSNSTDIFINSKVNELEFDLDGAKAFEHTSSINLPTINSQIQTAATCMLYVVSFEGKDYIFFDPFDPNCAKFKS